MDRLCFTMAVFLLLTAGCSNRLAPNQSDLHDSSLESEDAPVAVLIHLKADESITINGQATSLIDLRSKLVEMMADKEGIVTYDIAAEVPVGAFLDIQSVVRSLEKDLQFSVHFKPLGS